MTLDSTIPGTNGNLYVFDITTDNIYEVLSVFNRHNTTGVETDATEFSSLADLEALLGTSETIDVSEYFSYYLTNDWLYFFVHTSVHDTANRVVMSVKKAFERSGGAANIFDVFDNFIGYLCDYSEQIYAGTSAQRASKITERSIADFEDKATNNELPT